MSKRLLALNLLLAAAAVALSIQLLGVLSARRPLPPPSVLPAVKALVPPKEDPPVARPPLAAYSVVATKNLFNPNRSEAMAQPGATAKPVLHGVVINGEARLAYLEDPVTKRVSGYKTGDTVAGGVLEQIEPDRVVIKRREGPIEVKLVDPSKPKPVASPPQPAPGVALPAGVPVPPTIAPSAPGVPQPVLPEGARPPNLLQRLQGATEAPGTPPRSR